MSNTNPTLTLDSLKNIVLELDIDQFVLCVGKKLELCASELQRHFETKFNKHRFIYVIKPFDLQQWGVGDIDNPNFYFSRGDNSYSDN